MKMIVVEAEMKEEAMKAVNVMVNGQCEATIQLTTWRDLDGVKADWQGVEGVELRPAGGKVFGRSRHHARGLVRRGGKWWTL